MFKKINKLYIPDILISYIFLLTYMYIYYIAFLLHIITACLRDLLNAYFALYYILQR